MLWLVGAGMQLPPRHVEDALLAADFYANKARCPCPASQPVLHSPHCHHKSVQPGRVRTRLVGR